MELSKFRKLAIIFGLILGVILHYTYKLSNYNSIVAIFSAVNESTWEHLKLVFFPMLISSIIGYFIFGKEISNYWCARIKGILVAMCFIIAFFYTYTGILGLDISILSIASFFIAIIIGEWISFRKMNKAESCDNKIAIILIIILFIAFAIFTFAPPKINLFKDPLTGDYGISQKLNA